MLGAGGDPKKGCSLFTDTNKVLGSSHGSILPSPLLWDTLTVLVLWTHRRRISIAEIFLLGRISLSGKGNAVPGDREAFQLSTCTLQCCISPVHEPGGSAQPLTILYLLKVWRVHKRKNSHFFIPCCLTQTHLLQPSFAILSLETCSAPAG